MLSLVVHEAALTRNGVFRLLFLLVFGLVLGAGCARVSSSSTDQGGGGQSGGAERDAAVFDARPRPPVVPDAIVPPPVTGDGEVCNRELRAVVRDFRTREKDGLPKHPDFDAIIAVDKGIVERMLGADSKPVYAGGTAGTTSTKENFDQWYRDVPGINLTYEKNLPLSPDPARAGVFVFDSNAFFPLGAGEGWGDETPQNFNFTTELHFSFSYKGGEVLTFRGDDDVFLFVNGRLAIDLGGVHSAQTGTVDLDQQAADLGLTVGGTYRMALFHAERRCCESNFRLETTLSCIDNIVVP